MKDARFAKTVLLVNGLVPLVMLGWDALHGRLGANPIEFFIHTTGIMALIFLALSLAVTPVRKIGGWNFLSHFRRMLGLFAFGYALLHLLAWIILDRAGSLRSVVEETIRRPFITFGMAAFLMMLPLAITSTNAAIRRMGARRWKLLHRLVYAAAISGVLHYWYKEKADIRWPLVFAIILGALLLYRIVESIRLRPHVRLANKTVGRA